MLQIEAILSTSAKRVCLLKVILFTNLRKVMVEKVKTERTSWITFAFKAIWYMTIRKPTLLPDLKPLQNVPDLPLFKLCKFHEKISG